MVRISKYELFHIGFKNVEIAHICGVSEVAVHKWSDIPERFHKRLIKEAAKRGKAYEKFVKRKSNK